LRTKQLVERAGGLGVDEQLGLPTFQSSVHVFAFEHDLTPGAHIDSTILKEIRRSDCFIVLLSRYSVLSEYVNQEIGVAIEQRISILPIALEPIKPPAMISRLNYLPLYENPTKQLTWLKKWAADQADKKLGRAMLGVLGAIFALAFLGGKKK